MYTFDAEAEKKVLKENTEENDRKNEEISFKRQKKIVVKKLEKRNNKKVEEKILEEKVTSFFVSVSRGFCNFFREVK